MCHLEISYQIILFTENYQAWIVTLIPANEKRTQLPLKKYNVYQNSPFRIRLRRLYAPMHKTLLDDISGNHRWLKTQSTKQTIQSQIEDSCLVDVNLADELKHWFKTNDFMLNLAFSFWNLFKNFMVHV